MYEDIKKDVYYYFSDVEEYGEIIDKAAYYNNMDELAQFLANNNLTFKDVESYYNNNDFVDESDISLLKSYLKFFNNVEDYEKFINEKVTYFNDEVDVLIKEDNKILISFIPFDELVSFSEDQANKQN